MPSRLSALAIVLFWMATTAWMFQRDIWPHLRSGEPPPFSIDLADEAQRGFMARTPWKIIRGEEKIGVAQTWIQYREADDSFELHCKIDELKLRMLLFNFVVRHFHSMDRVSREGSLREMLFDAELTLKGVPAMAGLIEGAAIHFEGKVESGRFLGKGYAQVGGSRIPVELEPVEVSERASVFSPLHPVNRIRGVHPGQHWRMPVLDPLSESIKATLRKYPGVELLLDKLSGPSYLNAEVATEPRELVHEGHVISCLVIEYTGGQVRAQTWVSEKDGAVYRQQTEQDDERLILERE